MTDRPDGFTDREWKLAEPFYDSLTPEQFEIMTPYLKGNYAIFPLPPITLNMRVEAAEGKEFRITDDVDWRIYFSLHSAKIRNLLSTQTTLATYRSIANGRKYDAEIAHHLEEIKRDMRKEWS